MHVGMSKPKKHADKVKPLVHRRCYHLASYTILPTYSICGSVTVSLCILTV